MEQRVQSFTSSPYQYVVGYPGPQNLSRCDSHQPITSKPGHGSFDERSYAHHYPHAPSSTQSLSAPADDLDSWVLEKPPCGSPLSTSSSISHTESVPTPTYTGMPMYDQVDSPVFQHIRSPISHDSWSGEPEPVWRSSYPEITTWGSQQFSMPYHGGSICDQLPLQPIQEYIPQAGPSAAPSYIPYPTLVRYPAAEVIGSAPFKQELASNCENSDMDSDSESEDSGSDDDDSSNKSLHSTSRGCGANFSVMKLRKWGNGVYALPPSSEPRHHRCPLEDREHPGNLCPKRFVRPEHLRRHVRTVHSDERGHRCKVCFKPFSRGDNLREHYWTHLSRGGRAGQNKKMSLLELKAILGPKERRLVKRLKMKLHNTRAKQTKAKV